MINNRGDEQSVIRRSGNISYLCLRHQDQTRRPPDNGQEEKHTETKETKGTDASRPTDTEEALVYDLQLPPRPLLHMHMQTQQGELYTHAVDHTLPCRSV